MVILIKIINKIRDAFFRRSSASFIRYLRKKGVEIGSGTVIRQRTCRIDLTRPSLITIGNNVLINDNFTLLTHDFVSGVFKNSGRQFLNSSGKVTIGNNVRFGQNVMILKNVTIGDNCFIGAGSIVNRDIPSNSIAVGNPCRVVSSLEAYYQKRLLLCEREAFEYARSIVERYKRIPRPSDFWEEFHLFVSGNEIEKYPMIPFLGQLGPTFESYTQNHIAKFSSFEAFLQAAGIDPGTDAKKEY